MQHDPATIFSWILGDTNTINPCPLIKAEKLETQNGMRYNLKVCQGSLSPILPEETLSTRPVPITALIPTELVHILGEGSK
ncbi:hypothetical protein [Pseudanabaena sp. PCC 6802]|uniref:hypothetical protein n=1 Tax=Pseudanabaena sp. PCC 6802 TaxID=118173 RepID=UPI0012EAC422|nr:hypothetical protein [Pseudanabaena sp. PCC 6802]